MFNAPHDWVLLTAFTITLAENQALLMDSLCADEPTVRKRIEVTHVHALVAAVRKQARESFVIVSEDQAHDRVRAAAARHDTLGFPVSFYQAEWQEVVQEREALSEEVYLQVDREGRGRGLTRRQRMAIWKVLAGLSRGPRGGQARGVVRRGASRTPHPRAQADCAAPVRSRRDCGRSAGYRHARDAFPAGAGWPAAQRAAAPGRHAKA